MQLYEQDYNLWLEQTSAQLRQRDFSHLDIENLIEEIEGLGKSDRREIYNRLVRLYEHQLKLDYWHEERERNERSWKLTIREQSLRIERILKDSPSLRNYREAILDEAYGEALENVKILTGLEMRFPAECPYKQSI
jgi:hypothetical protein